METLLRIVLCGALALASLPVAAWSREGHELVGELAERRLSPAARDEVGRLLAGEQEPTLAGVAAWADDLRAEGRAHGHALGKRSQRWHYVNFPRTAACEPAAADCADGECVTGAIVRQRGILADRTRPAAERAQALKFLVHLVGDVHQPLHAGFREDRGGNGYQVNYRGRTAKDGREATNLHRVWDYHVLRSAGLSRDAHADRLETVSSVAVEPPGPWDPAAPARWAAESCALIADHALYPRGHVLGNAYADRHLPLAERRVLQAAFRLAALVEGALAPAR